MKRILLGAACCLLIAAAAAGCQNPNAPRPVPSVREIGAQLACTGGDHGYSDPLGWGFCYPGTWVYSIHGQDSITPPGQDVAFDITNVPPCVTPSAIPGQPSPRAVCPPDSGLFAFMIISTYQKKGASSLAAWVTANIPGSPTTETIHWGNSLDAVKLADGKRLAWTPNQVVMLDLHSGAGNLDLESEMSKRLETWKFTV